MIRCPLCNKKSFGAGAKKIKTVLAGISVEKNIDKAKVQYPDYGWIINETVVWSLFQEKNHKRFTPMDIATRVRVVIDINYPDATVDEQTVTLMSVHVLDILRFIERVPDAEVTKAYELKLKSFDTKKYWNQKV